MTPLERNDLHAAIERRYPDNTSEYITPELLRDGLHDLVDSVFVKATDVPTVGAVYLRLRNGKTLWHLGTGVREKNKLWLRKFGTGTLPAILPEPVLSPDRPVGIAAPGLPFPLHPSIGGPATGPATIAEHTKQVSDGEHFLLTGADLDQAKYPVYQGGLFLATTVTAQHSQRASVRLPRTGASYDAALTWASTASGLSEPVLLNTAVLLWGQEETTPGLKFSIFGRNLVHGNVAGGASYLALQPVSGGSVKLLTGSAADGYCADFATPQLAYGDYYYWPHNGHGGDYGWGERGLLKVVAPQDHVKTHDFGPATYVKLSLTDAAANVATINQAFQLYPHFCTDEGAFPINAQLYPRDNRKWSCLSPTGRTILRAAGPWQTQYLGMFGSNSWRMGMLERICFLDADNVVPYKTTSGFYNQALLDLRRATGQTGNEHIWLKDVETRWARPYVEILNNKGQVVGIEEAQGLHVDGARNFFLDNYRTTGTGTHFGNSGDVFIENYWHRLTLGADHTLYGLHVDGLSIKGFDFQDLDPTSTDGALRGAGRGPKFGGQGGTNQNTYIRDLNGRLLGPLFTGTRPYFDRNQGEMCLYEGNRTVWQNRVVSATATTITFAGPVLSNPTAVAGGTSPDDPAAGVLPGYHLLWIGRGRGLDQVRAITSVNGNTITLDKPLRVVPDATSLVQVGTFTRGNTLVHATLTGKRSIVDDAAFGIQCALNFYGGMFDTIADDFNVTDTRHGVIFTPTVHANGQLDTVAFCQMLNSTFTGQRWVERYEAYGKEEELTWSFPCSGLRNILVANITASNWLEARVVFKTPRDAADIAAYWPDAPPIDGLVRQGMAVVTNYLNDYRTPAGYGPPIPVVAGTLAGFVQSPVQALVAPTAPGVQLVAGDEIGPLEALPTDAAIAAGSGVLSYTGVDPAVLVYVDGQKEIPLDRTPVAAGSGSSGTPAPAGDAYTKAESDTLLAAKADVGTSYTKGESDTLLVAKADVGASYLTTQADARFGRLAFANTWEEANTFTRYAEFTSSYLPGKVVVSSFGLSIALGVASVNVAASSIEFGDSQTQRGARLAYVNGVLKLSSDTTIEVGQEPTTPLGIAPKSYVDRVLASVQAPLVGLVNGVAKGFATLELAISGNATIIRLNAGIVNVDTVTSARGITLLGNGSTIVIGNAGQLRLLRNASLYHCTITATGAGNIQIIGNGVPGGSTVPAPAECVQVVESLLDVPLNFGPVNSYQGLALRGNSIVTNLASGGGPVYLYDLAELSGPVPAGFTVIDKRPGGASSASAKLDLQISTTAAQQDTFQYFFVFPFSQVDRQLNTTAAVLDGGTHELIIPRAARGILQFRLALKNAAVSVALEFAIQATHTDGSKTFLLNGMFSPASTGGSLGAIDTKSGASRFTLAAGDRIQVFCYAVQPAQLRGDDVTCYLAFIED